MGRARDKSPDRLISGGMTLREAAQELTARLRHCITEQQVHYLAKRRGAVEVGWTTRSVEREIAVDAIDPADLDRLEEAARESLTVAAR